MKKQSGKGGKTWEAFSRRKERKCGTVKQRRNGMQILQEREKKVERETNKIK